MTRVFSIAAFCALAGTLLAASQAPPGMPMPQMPARDHVATPVGTASIGGVIVSDDGSNKPIRRATVTLESGDLRSPQSTVTDDDGKFVIGSLPAGNYSLTVTKPAYVSAYFGGKKPGVGPGVPIAVLDGQRVTGISVKLLHGSVITGTVRSSIGQPTSGLQIQVSRVELVNGRRQTDPLTSSATTDDRGVYRVFGLAPGDYIVQTTTGFSASNSPQSRRVTADEVAWAQAAMAPANSTTAGAAPALAAAPTTGRNVTYAPVYFPGTTDASAATPVSIGQSEERSGVDLSTQLVPTAKVTGTVVDAEGRPAASIRVSLASDQPDALDVAAAAIAMMGLGGTSTSADGTFTINGVTPGRYVINARGTPPRPSAAGAAATPATSDLSNAMSMLGGLMGGGGAGAMWATDNVAVQGQDIAGLSLRLQPGMTVSGKVVFESTTLTPPDPTRVRVMFGTIAGDSSPAAMAVSMIGGSLAFATADGTFVLHGITPNKYRADFIVPGMSMGAAPTVVGGWVLKSIMLNGHDVSDLPLEVKPSQDVTGLVATFTDRPTELRGTLQDQAGRTSSSYPIIVFSTDRAYWTPGSRRVQQARPSSDGKFTVVGLPAGEYYVCAVTDLEPNQLSDPAFLGQLAASSFKITLADGEKKTQDLKLAGG